MFHYTVRRVKWRASSGARRTSSFTHQPGTRFVVVRLLYRHIGRRSAELRAAVEGGVLCEHRVPRQECGETWQMVTCACPQCGGGTVRPKARTLLTSSPPSSHLYSLVTTKTITVVRLSLPASIA
ncbi:hypothetical protein JOB18_016568 [Solea senegalensis]|uniref:Uncharacterized protein n=1 Tax=Solea senegalensis TaxID=28829 RepID=A0AAV6SL40_SOLSE|nr:hypothetical protein JOB18_016568 [Solea senegalensis]